MNNEVVSGGVVYLFKVEKQSGKKKSRKVVDMKKIFVIGILLLLAGCGREPIMLNDMTVKDKYTDEDRLVWSYSVTLEKGGHEIDLKIYTKNEYDALKEGSIITVTYGDNYYIESLEFPKLQSKTIE